MGKRSRKPPPGQGEPKKRLTGAERDEIARAGLTPLEPGERPAPVVVASVVAVVLAISNLGLFLAGFVAGNLRATGRVLTERVVAAVVVAVGVVVVAPLVPTWVLLWLVAATLVVLAAVETVRRRTASLST